MVVTRSHKTFDDDDDAILDLNDKIKTDAKSMIPTENESDSDDAPEEESMSVGKARVLEQKKAQDKVLKEKREATKQKYKEIEEKRKLAKLEKEIKELEKQRKELNNIIDDIPDELPQDLLENLEIPDDKSVQQRKKIVFDDSEESKKLEKVNKKKIREERLKKLRELKSTNERQVDGGINVKIVSTGSVNTIKSETLKRKDAWLMRKRIRRE